MSSTFLDRPTQPLSTHKKRWRIVGQLFRFCSVGGLNTFLDLLAFNALVLWWPTQHALTLVVYNSLAYAVGATNSFLWNKYWTFGERTPVTVAQLLRFALVTALGIVCNDAFLWLAGHLLTSLALSGWLWTNAAKIVAISGSFLVSYLGMRLGVFAQIAIPTQIQTRTSSTDAIQAVDTSGINELPRAHRSLSVVLPAYNEAANMVHTLTTVLDTLQAWKCDFEILVVDDGSVDQTAALVQQFAWQDSRVRLLLHNQNRGYGEALKTGFAQATKHLTFFMDSDGQFALQDLATFFPLIEEYDAVLGYRIKRQDTLMRKVNAWCWNRLVGFVFGIRVRDIDCAFKLFRSSVLQSLTLESGGAMINTEILYKWARRGATYTEVGVQHYPRRAGKATGAKLRVIVRALSQLWQFAEKWRVEEEGEGYATTTTAQNTINRPCGKTR